MPRRRGWKIAATVAATAMTVMLSAPAMGQVSAGTVVSGGKVTVVMDRALVSALTADGVTWAATDGGRVTENGSSVIWTFRAEPSRQVNLATGTLTVELVGGMEFVGQGLRKDYNALRVSIAAGTAMLEGDSGGAWTGIAILGQAKVPSRPTGSSLRIRPFAVYTAPGAFMVMTDDGMTSIAPSVGSSQVFGAIGMNLKVK